MTRFCITISVAFFILLGACDSDKQPLLPKVTGKPGEIVLVMDEYQWGSETGEFFRETFSQPVIALPEDEPIYDIVRIPSSGFSNLFKSHRNIILTKISSRHQKPRIIVQRDIWAKPQIVINVIGPKDSTTLNYLIENREKLVTLIDQIEIERTVQNYKKNRAKGIDQILRTEHNLSISVPAGYNFDVDTARFIWISHEPSDRMQGVLIYYYDYTDPNTFTEDFLVKKRNEYTRRFVPGPNAGSYMSVESEAPIYFREYTKDDRYFAEIRGLWKLENGFMGGPFISITTLDESRNRVITAEGFVFAPGKEKRNYIRELQAILQTFKVVE
ncbi:MAG: DUF4837 family protein [Bacteroidales bacterium]|nr:DUF4837 family protein [Bacteroidales bacterium]